MNKSGANSHTVLKVNFCPKIQFWQNFTFKHIWQVLLIKSSSKVSKKQVEFFGQKMKVWNSVFTDRSVVTYSWPWIALSVMQSFTSQWDNFRFFCTNAHLRNIRGDLITQNWFFFGELFLLLWWWKQMGKFTRWTATKVEKKVALIKL